MPTQITVRSVTKSLGGKLVLDDVTCTLTAGERTGITGENGSGKSTLLRLLAGEIRPDHGAVVVRSDGGVGYFAQEGRLSPDATVRQVVDEALGELRAIESRMRRLETAMAAGDTDTDARTGTGPDIHTRTHAGTGPGPGHDAVKDAVRDAVMAEYGELLTVFELRGGYEADARVESALHGLGLGALDHDRTVGSMSGGQRVRLRLAAVLAAAPEVLLLDEPTNHLDESALGWLEDHLRTRRGTTVAVCHDRLFLERVATTLLEVDADRRTLVRHGGGYAGHLAAKEAARQRWIHDHAQWQAGVDRFREAAATTARRVAPGRAMKDGNKMAYDRAAGRVQQSLAGRVRQAEERLNRLLADPVPAPPEPLRFTPVLRAGRLRGAVLDAAGVAVTDRLHPVGLTVTAGEHLLVTGANGAGKSTLLSVLAGRIPPDSGRVARRGRIGYLPQQPEFDRPGDTLLAAFARGRAGHLDDHAERLLALGLFTRDRLTVPVGGLSTGQRQRLALARLLSEPADVLLLDEPTNHVSPALGEELEAALADYAGTLVVVSHDRLLCRRWQGTRLDLTATPAAKSGAAAAVTA
ncbi:ABC-F family ATP-binding cassette domain-containing protein [Streptomyces yaizuensis]|uniref:ATP-binding cassette domain-containing protein n=1 Tax=Streptomyces yaizuensis TaxID=2989713 RepID=A0ABQ5NX05_9ACTN|nr:ABC-F family ATP-binding cassette domain-containing protein [Streptomyces sp. YSPA8]GLF94887.1 ATP-binding cassette domain-containing protein [Streptomyces sp. YSPA8]